MLQGAMDGLEAYTELAATVQVCVTLESAPTPCTRSWYVPGATSMEPWPPPSSTVPAAVSRSPMLPSPTERSPSATATALIA